MLTEDQIRRAAATMDAARREGRRLATLPDDLRPRTTAEAEAISAATAALSPDPVGGWKLGAADGLAPTKAGLERGFCGPIRAQHVVASPARMAHGDLLRPVVEAEFAFRMARDLPPGGEPFTREAVAEAVAAVIPAIEVPESRFTDDNDLGPLAILSDLGFAGRLVLGRELAEWRQLDLPARHVRLSINGRTVGEGTAARAMGHPLDALLWLANLLAERGQGLRAGQVVTTGSCTGFHYTQPGDRVTADFGELGTVELELTA